MCLNLAFPDWPVEACVTVVSPGLAPGALLLGRRTAPIESGSAGTRQLNSTIGNPTPKRIESVEEERNTAFAAVEKLQVELSSSRVARCD